MLKTKKKSRKEFKGTRGNKRLVERKMWQKEMDQAIRIAKESLAEEMCEYIKEKI